MYDRYRDVWWVLDSQHTHQCFDCQQLAAQSPYALATLYQMPGDGHTYCGRDCTCIVSFLPPEQTYPPGPPLPADALTPLQRLLRVYTHGQVWYLALASAIPALLAAPSNRGWPHPNTVPEATPDQARFIPPGLY